MDLVTDICSSKVRKNQNKQKEDDTDWFKWWKPMLQQHIAQTLTWLQVHKCIFKMRHIYLQCLLCSLALCSFSKSQVFAKNRHWNGKDCLINLEQMGSTGRRHRCFALSTGDNSWPKCGKAGQWMTLVKSVSSTTCANCANKDSLANGHRIGHKVGRARAPQGLLLVGSVSFDVW